MPTARWCVRLPAPASCIAHLMQELKVPPLIASVLWARGLHTDVKSTLEPPLELSEMPALAEAAERLAWAIKHKKRILIHGDYDADGISGSSVLVLGLRALGADAKAFIPNRLTDGYGIYLPRVPEHIAACDLFVTVDCGVTNLEEIAALQQGGVEIIVTDHHQPSQTLPSCLIVHPKTSPKARKGLPELTGSGVAYHLLWALHERCGLPPPLEYSDLASIGIIADVAPLMGENRALIREGLARMAQSAWVGVRACLRQTNLTAPSARDVAFVIAPRLNAAGRLGEADLGLELLTTASERRAKELAVYLDARNDKRKEIQNRMEQEALRYIDVSAPAIVVADVDAKDTTLDWNPGVMGIVASRLLERVYKPVFIIAKGKGSVRSTPGISAVEALHATADCLLRFGGHSQAAGFAIDEAQIADFRAHICDFVAQYDRPQPLICADALIAPCEVEKDLLDAAAQLEPTGEGHAPPLFALNGALDRARAVGKDQRHLQLVLEGIKGVSWHKGEMASRLTAGARVNAAVSIRENTWRGKTTLEFLADDLRPAEQLAVMTSEPLPTAPFYRGRPPEQTDVTIFPSPQVPQTPAQLAASMPLCVWLRALPLHPLSDGLSDGLCPTQLFQSLEMMIAQGTGYLWFDLSGVALAELEALAATFPSVQELRLAFVSLSRGQQPPFIQDKATLCRRCLHELDLIDDHGRPRKGQKREPYSSETLRAGLMARYKLRTFISAYRYLDDQGFALSVARLFKGDAKAAPNGSNPPTPSS